MRNIPTHSDFVAEKVQELIRTAQDIIDGSVGVIAGCRKIVALQRFVEVDALDADFLPIIGIVSETDHLPIGDVRQIWNPDALAEQDIEIGAAQEFFRASANNACAKLINRFGP